jgi:hypothetical protein
MPPPHVCSSILTYADACSYLQEALDALQRALAYCSSGNTGSDACSKSLGSTLALLRAVAAELAGMA